MNPTNERLEKMAEWAKTVNEQLAELRTRMLPSYEQCDKISLELSELYSQYQDVGATLQDCDVEIARLSHVISGLNDSIDVMEADAFLEVCSLVDDNGKPKFSNDAQRKAAVKFSLNKNDEYIKKKEEKRKTENELMVAKATRNSLDNSLSEYRNRVRTLTAILNNLTARIHITK